ncbi:MAG: alpha/beta hydrolase-fold protein [Halieaceae bacterium]|jgi:S-formylglutathione hydrolase FrmB|nr:alpha/beta hydrolase-fold protein [Halieaceae bacterium]
MRSSQRRFLLLALLIVQPWGWSACTWADDVTRENRTDLWSTPVIQATHLRHQRFYSDTAQAEVSFHIFTPHLYGTQAQRRFPVLYWLHGRSGVPKQLNKFAEYFDHAIRKREIPPMLVVFPSGAPETMWVNSKDGTTSMETIVIKELIPHIDAHYRTIAAQRGRIIEGFSMGGYGAARLGFNYPELFAAISILGAGPLQKSFTDFGSSGMAQVRKRTMTRIYGDDQEFFMRNSPWVIAEKNVDAIRSNAPVIRIAIGEQDRMLETNRAFAKHLDRLNIPHDLMILPEVGHNTRELIKALGPSNWAFYRSVLAPKRQGFR